MLRVQSRRIRTKPVDDLSDMFGKLNLMTDEKSSLDVLAEAASHLEPMPVQESKSTLYGNISNLLFSTQKVILLLNEKTSSAQATIYHLLIFIVRSIQCICSSKKNVVAFILFCFMLHRTAWGRPIIEFMVWVVTYAYKHGLDVGAEVWIENKKEIVIETIRQGKEMAKTCLVRIFLGLLAHAEVQQLLDTTVSKSTGMAMTTALNSVKGQNAINMAMTTALNSVQGQNAIKMALTSSAVGSTLNLVYEQNKNLIGYSEGTYTLLDVAKKMESDKFEQLVQMMESEKLNEQEMMKLLQSMQSSIKTTEMQKVLEMVVASGVTPSLQQIMDYTYSMATGKTLRLKGGTKRLLRRRLVKKKSPFVNRRKL